MGLNTVNNKYNEQMRKEKIYYLQVGAAIGGEDLLTPSPNDELNVTLHNKIAQILN